MNFAAAGGRGAGGFRDDKSSKCCVRLVRSAEDVCAQAEQMRSAVAGHQADRRDRALGTLHAGQAQAYGVTPGKNSVVSRGGTLTYAVAAQTTADGLGQSTCIAASAGNPVNGVKFIDRLEMFQADDDAEGIFMIGEIGRGRGGPVPEGHPRERKKTISK